MAKIPVFPLFLICLSLVACKNTGSEGVIRCQYYPEVPAALEIDEVTSIKDSCAQLTIKLTQDDEYFAEYVMARIINLETDSSDLHVFFEADEVTFNLESGTYALDMRIDIDRDFSMDTLELKAFQNRSLTISIGSSSMFVEYQEIKPKD